MTDLEWDRSTDPTAMIQFVADYERSAWVARKLRLFAAAACRLVWSDMPDWRSREAVEEAERVIARPGRRSRLAALQAIANDVWSVPADSYRYWFEDVPNNARVARRDLALPALAAGRCAAACADPDALRGAREAVEALGPVVGSKRLCELIREVCGNPLRRPLARRWWSEDVRAVARTLEADRAFGRLPILSDALLDAGCDDEEMIRHCQQDRAHALGCWALDLALGRD